MIADKLARRPMKKVRTTFEALTELCVVLSLLLRPPVTLLCIASKVQCKSVIFYVPYTWKQEASGIELATPGQHESLYRLSCPRGRQSTQNHPPVSLRHSLTVEFAHSYTSPSQIRTVRCTSERRSWARQYVISILAICCRASERYFMLFRLQVVFPYNGTPTLNTRERFTGKVRRFLFTPKNNSESMPNSFFKIPL